MMTCQKQLPISDTRYYAKQVWFLIFFFIFSLFLGIFIPSFVETVYLWPNMGWGKWKLIKNILLCILSLCALVAGAAVSIDEIIKLYK